MLAFEVYLNGRKVALAGADDLSVLTADVCAAGKLGPKAIGTKYQPKGYDLHLHVSGLTGRKNKAPNDHLNWTFMKKVKIGDEILVRVLRIDHADPPMGVSPADPKRMEREDFRWAKARYLKLRKKYEKPRAKRV
jgi:hypothetical protein